MAKQRLVIKTGEYTNQQGETKGEYTRLGVMLDGQNGPYILMDVTVSLAGCLAKQNMMNHKAGKEVRDTLMVSVFEDQPQGQQNQGQQQPSQQQAPQGGFDSSSDIPF